MEHVDLTLQCGCCKKDVKVGRDKAANYTFECCGKLLSSYSFPKLSKLVRGIYA